jgi:hypothetical protein
MASDFIGGSAQSSTTHPLGPKALPTFFIKGVDAPVPLGSYFGNWRNTELAGRAVSPRLPRVSERLAYVR